MENWWRKPHEAFFDRNPNSNSQVKIPNSPYGNRGYRCKCGEHLNPRDYDHCPRCQRIVRHIRGAEK